MRLIDETIYPGRKLIQPRAPIEGHITLAGKDVASPSTASISNMKISAETALLFGFVRFEDARKKEQSLDFAPPRVFSR